MVRGWGINISEDFRHWIGLLQYNPSTLLHIKSYILSYIHVSFTNWYSVGAPPTCGDYIIYEGMSLSFVQYEYVAQYCCIYHDICMTTHF